MIKNCQKYKRQIVNSNNNLLIFFRQKKLKNLWYSVSYFIVGIFLESSNYQPFRFLILKVNNFGEMFKITP
jgi:hypothetical protein